MTVPNVIAAQAGPTVAASLLDADWNAIRDYVNDREITQDTLANRPVAGISGRLYFATDTTDLYADTGSAWTRIALVPFSQFNWTYNGDVEIWGGGTAVAPTGWTAAGAGVALARTTTGAKVSTYAAQITPGGGAAGQLYQDIDLIAGFGPAALWQGRTVTLGAWVRATAATQARLVLNDGVGTTNGSFHNGNSTPQFLTVSRTLDAAATRVRLMAEVAAAGAAAQFDGLILVIGGIVLGFTPSGWRGRKSVLLLGTRFDTTVAAGSTVYLYSSGHSTTADLYKLPYNAVLRNLRADAIAAPGAGETFVYTVRLAAGATAVTCTTSNPNTNSLDVTNEAVAAAGAGLSVSLVTSGGAAATNHVVAVELEERP